MQINLWTSVFQDTYLKYKEHKTHWWMRCFPDCFPVPLMMNRLPASLPCIFLNILRIKEGDCGDCRRVPASATASASVRLLHQAHCRLLSLSFPRKRCFTTFPGTGMVLPGNHCRSSLGAGTRGTQFRLVLAYTYALITERYIKTNHMEKHA